MSLLKYVINGSACFNCIVRPRCENNPASAPYNCKRMNSTKITLDRRVLKRLIKTSSSMDIEKALYILARRGDYKSAELFLPLVCKTALEATLRLTLLTSTESRKKDLERFVRLLLDYLTDTSSKEEALELAKRLSDRLLLDYPTDISSNAGNVGVGSTVPNAKLEIEEALELAKSLSSSLAEVIEEYVGKKETS